MDKNNQPLTECITWADNRASEYADKINNEHNGLEIYKKNWYTDSSNVSIIKNLLVKT